MIRKLSLWVVSSVVGLVAALGLLTIVPHPVVEDNPWNPEKPLVIAHAGGKGVMPDNTLKAYKYAHSIGAVLEMDVQITLDDILITRHGENNTGNLRDLTQCDLVSWEHPYQYLYENCNAAYHYVSQGETPYQNLTFDEWVADEVHITTVEEVFQTFGDSTLYVIEIKADANAPRTRPAQLLGELILQYGLEEHVLVASFHDDIMDYFAANFPQLYLNAGSGPTRTMVLHSYSFSTIFHRDNRFVAISIPTSYSFPVINRIYLDNRFVTGGLHRLGVAVHYWTINDPDTMRHLIRIGADGIITDYPELLQQIIAEELEQ
jgi:glycerophosphoryl diester phosphodiesterase